MDGLLIIVVIAVVVAIFIWGIYAAAKRRKELLAWADAHQLSFDQGNDHGLDGQYPQFGCLRSGDNRYGYNHMIGSWQGHSFHGFDYHYQTYTYDSKGRRHTHHHHFSAVIMNSAIPLQKLLIRPEGFFDKVTEFFGADDIDFESTDFSNKFYVKAPDKRWAFDVIHQRTMQFLLDSPRYTLHLEGEYVIAYRNSKFSVEDFEGAGNVIHGILERLPGYVIQERTGQS